MKTIIDRPLDLEDLLATPEDGNRYEVLDGALVMTPPPGTDHQRAVIRLAVILDQVSRTRGLQAFTAPLAWRIAPGQVPEPDPAVPSLTALRLSGRPTRSRPGRRAAPCTSPTTPFRSG